MKVRRWSGMGFVEFDLDEVPERLERVVARLQSGTVEGLDVGLYREAGSFGNPYFTLRVVVGQVCIGMAHFGDDGLVMASYLANATSPGFRRVTFPYWITRMKREVKYSL